jgi:hypothetical protein
MLIPFFFYATARLCDSTIHYATGNHNMVIVCTAANFAQHFTAARSDPGESKLLAEPAERFNFPLHHNAAGVFRLKFIFISSLCLTQAMQILHGKLLSIVEFKLNLASLLCSLLLNAVERVDYLLYYAAGSFYSPLHNV